MEEAGTTSDDLAHRLGHRFRRPDLLIEALTHPSAAGGRAPSYERLEFLGDRVLGLIVAHMLIARFPFEAEGELARRHAPLVSRDGLVQVARTLKLGRHIRMTPGEAAVGTRDNDSVLADTLEAVLGALYLDGGLAAAEAVIEEQWSPLIAVVASPPRDAKSALQEWAQARGRPLPAYETIDETGPAHRPVFTVEVRVEGLAPQRATGGSKRVAEQAAAVVALAEATGPADDG